MSKLRKSLCAAAACSVAVVCLGVGTAHADEAHGQGRSACHFSGLNDDPGAPFPEGGRVQSYGQLVRKGLKAEVPSPGVACNPNTATPE